MPSEVTIDQLADALSNGAFLLDVREVVEWEEHHIAGSVHVPMTELNDRIAEIPNDRQIFVICSAGGRSMRVANALEQSGYDAVSVAGGTNQWVDEGRPVETE